MNWYKKNWKPKLAVVMLILLFAGISSAAEVTQVVTLEPATINLNLQDEVSVNVYYQAIPDGGKTFAPNLWIHYASSQLEYLGYENFTNGYGALILGSPSDGLDTKNLDENADTDKKISIGYIDLNGQWPSISGKILLVTLKFKAIASGTIPINVKRNDGGGDSGFVGTGSTVNIALSPDNTPPSVNWVKANNTQTELTILQGVSNITLTSEITDGGKGDSNIVAAEYFIDPGSDPPSTQRGVSMAAADNSFDSATELVIATINTSAWSANQTHIIKVRGQDKVANGGGGNWSAFGTVTVKVILSEVSNTVSTLTVKDGITTGKKANNSDTYELTVTAKKK